SNAAGTDILFLLSGVINQAPTTGWADKSGPYDWWMIFHNFSEVNGISMCATPSASAMALATAGVEPIVPASPTPFTPSGLTVVSVTVESVSKLGSSEAIGMA